MPTLTLTNEERKRLLRECRYVGAESYYDPHPVMRYRRDRLPIADS